MEIKNIFQFGEKVIFKADDKARKMIITGFEVRAEGILYICSYFDSERRFYGFELESAEEGVIVENTKKRVISVKYLKGLSYEAYIMHLHGYSNKVIKSIIKMLVGAEEYEMAEVTKRYLERVTN